MKHLHHVVLLCLVKTILAFHLSSAVDFLFNGFDFSDLSLYGDAIVESQILTLTNATAFSSGRALYPWKIPTKQPNSSLVIPFSTSFIFAMAPSGGRFPGDGVVFCFVPRKGIEGSSLGQYLGLFNFSNHGNPNNHVFAVEFDVFENPLVRDINDNHVGIDVNSLISVRAHEAGYWADDKSFEKLTLNNGKNYQVWIDYFDGTVNVTLAPAGMKRPNRPLLSVPLNLSDVLEDEMYVGFSASTGAFIERHNILGWSFSNTDFSLSERLITKGLPKFELQKTPIHRTRGFIAGLAASVLLFVIICSVFGFLLLRRNKRKRKRMEEMEDWELEYWPHRISYQEIESATNNFSEDNVIGIGGNGKVYRGIFPGGSVVAVKRISRESSEGIRAFLAEISSLGRLKHRNLVGLRGWCKKEKGNLILVYDYMENGSLDKRVFECDESKMLNCEERIRILKQVAYGLMYLHYGWESKVLHRDIEASNVLLDKEMNARLGDFGLARMHDHDTMAGTTLLVGTVGYLAPEIVRSGRASTQTDVFGYGVLILEVICGRRPIEQGKPPLVEWLWELYREGELVSGFDPRLRGKGEVDEDELEKVLHLGLLCAHPDPKSRPTMRQVVKLFEGKIEVDEPDGGEYMGMYLLEKMKAEEYLFTSLSLSWANSIVVGW
ncbi:hypothetical protein DH2020_041925 [Rehmannia glutinosa]|uniref:Protein kinase domain-containing protein n=1 Tax=Rehmannia glutinosa TaxID=99300 RepID=A0ABR0UNT2_REHGL